MAIPAIIAGIAEPLLSITDTAIVGNLKINPTEALAAVGIAGSFITAIVWILSQTRSAISAIISQYLGANKIGEILKLPSQIIFINIVLSIVIYVVTIYFIDDIFTLYNARGLVLENAVYYYKIRSLGLPLTLFVFAVFGIFRGYARRLSWLLHYFSRDFFLFYDDTRRRSVWIIHGVFIF